MFNTLSEFANQNDNIWFGSGVFKTKNEEDIKNVLGSSLFQLTFGAQGSLQTVAIPYPGGAVTKTVQLELIHHFPVRDN